MKIAVTYDNGNVFQHFGRTENFKVYEVEDGRVLSSDVMNSNGVGHEALAWLLKDCDIDVLILTSVTSPFLFASALSSVTGKPVSEQ